MSVPHTGPQPPNTGPQTVKLDVSRSTGTTVFQTAPARLEWTAQDRIRVIDRDLSGGTAGERVVLDVAPQEIVKARFWNGHPAQLTFHTAEGKVRVDPIHGAMPSPEPWESLAQYNERLAGVTIPPPRWWIERLQGYGVDAKVGSQGMVVGIALGAAVVLIGVIAVLAAVFG